MANITLEVQSITENNSGATPFTPGQPTFTVRFGNLQATIPWVSTFTTPENPQGSGAIASATTDGSTVSVDVTAGGINYQIPPTVTITDTQNLSVTYTAVATVNTTGQVLDVTVSDISGFTTGDTLSVTFTPHGTINIPCDLNGNIEIETTQADVENYQIGQIVTFEL